MIMVVQIKAYRYTPPLNVGARPRSKTMETKKYHYSFVRVLIKMEFTLINLVDDHWILALNKCDTAQIWTETS